MRLWRAQCHCGTVRFVFDGPDTLDVTDCNCSLCAMTGYEHIFVGQADLRFISGENALTSYRFGTQTAEHLFCQTCGIKPLYRPRSHPDAWSVNGRCIEGLKVGQRIAFDGQNWDENIDDLRDRLDD